LVPVRVFGSTVETVRAVAVRSDDLGLAVFVRCERGAGLRLDFELVMGSSEVCAASIRRTTSAPRRQIARRGRNPEALQPLPVLTSMLGLPSNASPF